jgi:hypothetical protein
LKNGVFDNDPNNFGNYYNHKILPAYPGQTVPGVPMSMGDREFESSFFYGHTWSCTDAAVYQIVNVASGTYSDYVLGCISFTWYDNLRSTILTVPGVLSPDGKGVVIKEPESRQYGVGAALPDAVWNDALKNW